MKDTDRAIVAAEGVGRRATGGGPWILRDVHLAVQAGRRLAIQGPSASGKTVLLRTLSLLDPPDEGRVLWHGEPVAADQVPRFRSGVMYLHQRPALVEGSVEDNLRLPLSFRIHRERGFERDTLLRWLDAAGRDRSFLNKTSQNLSGGELQIVALLRVMQLQPDVLLLDEPTAALDQQTTESLEQLIQSWQAEQPLRRTFVIVTHDAGQAERLADQVLRMKGGKLLGET